MNKIMAKRLRYAMKKWPLVETAYGILRKKKAYTVKEEEAVLSTAPKRVMEWPDGITKPHVGLVKERGTSYETFMYWPKFERFLKSSQIPYSFIDVYSSRFMEEAESIDILLWRTLSMPDRQWEAETKIRLMEDELGVLCFPSMKDLWWYEDKERQYYLLKLNKLPVVETFISHSLPESLAFIENCEYPLISKIRTGSSSLGVKKIHNKREAKRLCKRVFGKGKSTYWSYVKQKDYVYLQRMVQNDGVDLRVICIGDHYFGYYRRADAGDFRASGTGKVEKYALPFEALELARKTRDALEANEMIAVDFIYDEVSKEYLIIEISIFVQTMTSITLKDNDIAGVYLYRDEAYQFKPGRFWVQELVCEELMKRWIEKQMEKRK